MKTPILMVDLGFSRSSKAVESNSQHLINRRTASYPQEAAGSQEATVDLHTKEFCVDVSTYQPVVWQEVDAEQCSTVFVKKCEDRSEEVCADVTETRCEVMFSLLSICSTELVQMVASYHFQHVYDFSDIIIHDIDITTRLHLTLF